MNLPTWLSTYIDPSYPLHSRVHPLNHFPQGAQWFVKRDDELSFGISGSKYRKYASLIPYLTQKKYTTVHLVGSSHSNHLVGILQLLNEKQITPIVYVLGDPNQPCQGNYGWMRLLLGKHTLHFLSKKEWSCRHTLIQKNLSSSCFYIPEGADLFASLPGALSLPVNIAHNASSLSLTWDHFFIDAGTGLAAIALLLGMPLVGLTGIAHVALMADTPQMFEQKLMNYKILLEQELGRPLSLPKYQLHLPAIGKSFGSINSTVFTEIRRLALEEGLLCDPIYSAKLFYTAKAFQQECSLTGNLLCIHSGGGLSLSGFPQVFL